jgi:NAD(P)H-binding
MEWVIIRPGGLTNDPKTGNAVVTENKGVCGAISREDVAPIIAKALFTDKLDGKVVTAVDSDRVTTKVQYEAIPL